MYFGIRKTLKNFRFQWVRSLDLYQSPDCRTTKSSEQYRTWLQDVKKEFQDIQDWIVKTFVETEAALIAGLTERELISIAEEAIACASLDQNDPKWEKQWRLMENILRKVQLDITREEARRDKRWFDIAQEINRIISFPDHLCRFQGQVSIYKDAWKNFFWEPAYQQHDFYDKHKSLKDQSQEPEGEGWHWQEMTFILQSEGSRRWHTESVWFNKWHPEFPKPSLLCYLEETSPELDRLVRFPVLSSHPNMPNQQHYNDIMRAAQYARLAILHDLIFENLAMDRLKIIPYDYHDSLSFEFYNPSITGISEYQTEFIENSFRFVCEDITREIEPFGDATATLRTYPPKDREKEMFDVGYVSSGKIISEYKVPNSTLEYWNQKEKDCDILKIDRVEDIGLGNCEKPVIIRYKGMNYYLIPWVEEKVKLWKQRKHNRKSSSPRP